MDVEREKRLKCWRSEMGTSIVMCTGLVMDLMWLLAEYAVPLAHYWVSRNNQDRVDMRRAKSPYSMNDCGTVAFRIDVAARNEWFVGVVWPKTSATTVVPNGVAVSPHLDDDYFGVYVSFLGNVFQRSSPKTYKLTAFTECRDIRTVFECRDIRTVETQISKNWITFISTTHQNQTLRISTDLSFAPKHVYPFVMNIGDPTKIRLYSIMSIHSS